MPNRSKVPPLRYVFGLLALSVVSVVLIGIFCYRDWREFSDATVKGIRTRQVLEISDALLSNLKDAETGQRGFLLTGERRYLDPYEKALLRLPGEVRRFTQLFRKNPAQQQQLESLQRLVDEKITELRETVALRESRGLAVALDVVRTDRGRQIMDQIREILAAVRSSEFGDLVAAAERADIHGRRALLITGFGGASLLALLTLAALALRSANGRSGRLISQLGRSEAQLRLIFDGVTDHAIVGIDSARVISAWNSGAERMMGWREDEIIGRSASEIFLPQDRDERKPELEVETALSTGRASEERWYLRKDGSTFWGSGVLTPLRDPAGGASGFVKIFRDMTEQKAAEAERLALLDAEQTARREAEDALERRAAIERQLLLLVDASGTLLASPASASVVDTVTHLAQRFVFADAYAVWRRYENGTWQVLSDAGLSENYSRTALDSSNGVPEEPMALDDVEQHPAATQRLPEYRAEGIRSLLTVPMRLHGRVAGSLVFYYRQLHSFSEGEIRIASALGNLAAAALGTAELYEQQMRLRDEAQQAERRSAFLAEAGRVLSASLEYETTLASTARLAVPAFADWCTVDLIDKDGSRKSVAMHHADPAKVISSVEFRRRFPPTGDDMTSRVLRTGQPEMIEHLTPEMIRAGARSPEYAEAILELGIRSCIVAPLVSGRHTIGVITLATGESGRNYGRDDLQLARELAHRAALAVENAHLYNAVRESEERFRRMADGAPVLVWLADTTKACTWFNKPWLDFTGRSQEQEYGFGWAEGIHPDDVERCVSLYTESFNCREAFKMEYRLRRHDGEYRWVLDNGTPLFDPSGGFTGYIGSCIDITEKIAAEQHLSQQVRDFETLLSVIPVGIGVAEDPECRSIRTNPAFASLLRIDQTENASVMAQDAGVRRFRVFHGGREVPPEELPMQVAARQGREVRNFELDLVFPDGSTAHEFGHATPLFDGEGKVRGCIGVFVDLTERRRSEAAVRRSEEQLRLITDALPVLVAYIDLSRRYRFNNRTYETWFECSRTDLIGKPVEDVIGREAYSRVKAHLDSAMDGQLVTFEAAMPYTGGPRNVRTMMIPDAGDDGSVRGIITLVEDITSEKRMAEVLRQSEERMRLAQLAAGIGTWDWDLETGEVTWSDELFRILQTEPAPIEVSNAGGWTKFIHSTDLDRFRREVETAIAGSGSLTSEFRITRPDGAVRWFLSKGQVFRNEQGLPVRMIGLSMDLTERKKIEAQLRGLSDAATAINAAESLEDALAAVTCSAREIIGTHQAFSSIPLKQDHNQTITKVSLSEKYVESRGYSVQGPELAASFRDRHGQNLGFIRLSGKYETGFTESDESILVQLAEMASVAIENARLYQSIRTANDQLRRANWDLEQFAYSASHDLQEPLRTVAIYTQLLESRFRNTLEAPADQFLTFIRQGALRMEALIRDLLSYTRTSAASDDPVEEVDPREALSRAIGNLDESIRSSGAVVNAGRLPAVMARPLHIQQLFHNLIGNAIKYRSADPPRIAIGAHREGAQILFSVRDNGIGLEQQYANKIFGLFKRLHGADEYPGTGIGLAICQRIVERYGGRIWVESELGCGAAFFFTLPTAEEQ